VQHDPAAHPDYRIEDGKLYRLIYHSLHFKDTAADEQWKRCIPKEARKEILRGYHDAPTNGHMGIAKTIARIAEKHYWPGMFRDIANYVRACENCQAHKASQQRPAGTLHSTYIGRPWEQVTLDRCHVHIRDTRGSSCYRTVSRSGPTILRPMGLLPPPPIPVEVEPGIIVKIPHFAVYVSRRYKPRMANGRWVVRFTRDGRIRYCRRLR